MSDKPKALVIKFGGSNAITEQGANKEYLRSFLSQIQDIIADRFDKAVFVIGGGIRCRMLQDQVEGNDEKDRVGIQSTWDHAAQLSEVAAELGFKPTAGIPENPEQAKEFLEASDYLAMGGLQIGQSTDAVSVYAATRFHKMGYDPTLIILSNIDAIYTADPRQNPDAKAIRESSVADLLEEGVLTNDPDDWRPGMSVTVDPVAVKIIQGDTDEQLISVYFGHGDDWQNTRRALLGEPTDKGTVLKAGADTKYYE